MTLSQAGTRQQILEARLARLSSRPLPVEATVNEIFGPFETWTLKLGPHTLLLHPVNKQWYTFDRLHQTWEPTGFGPGEAVFVIAGAHLGYRRHRGPRACPQCSEQMPDDSRFCPHCGADVAPVAVRCPACGHDTRPGCTFCTRCGARLGPQREVPA